MPWFHPIDKHLLFTKNDKEDPRLGECVQILPHGDPEKIFDHEFDFAVIGFSDDEGIGLNGGRVGASVAPREIRTPLYKMTPALSSNKLPRILDIGDIDREKPLADRHEHGRTVVRRLVEKNKSWISFGGGHDYGYADCSGFLDVHQGNAVIINFDAHLDVRPTNKGLNSGTPFFRVLSEFAGKVDFAEVGIQDQCNSKTHKAWAESKGAAIFTLNEVNELGLLPLLKKYLQGKEKKKIFLTVDIDAFTSSEAPGCSQSRTTGHFTQESRVAFVWMSSSFEVQGLAI